MQVEFHPRKVTNIPADRGIFNNPALDQAALQLNACVQKSHLFYTKLHLHLCHPRLHCMKMEPLVYLKGAAWVKLSRKVVTEAVGE